MGSANVRADDITVVHRPEERRYELLAGGERAGELVYRDRGDGVIALLHTEVEPKLQHSGLGNDARARGLRIVPVCPFVDAYVRRHPAYDDLVVGDPARRR